MNHLIQLLSPRTQSLPIVQRSSSPPSEVPRLPCQTAHFVADIQDRNQALCGRPGLCCCRMLRHAVDCAEVLSPLQQAVLSPQRCCPLIQQDDGSSLGSCHGIGGSGAVSLVGCRFIGVRGGGKVIVGGSQSCCCGWTGGR